MRAKSFAPTPILFTAPTNFSLPCTIKDQSHFHHAFTADVHDGEYIAIVDLAGDL